MAAKHNKITKIQGHKKKWEMNIGILIFLIILIYLIITVLMYTTSKQISAYEVRKGSIVKDNSYTGFIIREEQVITAQATGYVSFFQNENEKIKSGSNVYAVSSEKLDTNSSADDVSTIVNDELQQNMLRRTQNFHENFTSNKFSAVYSFKSDIQTVLQNATKQSKNTRLGEIISQSGKDVSVYQSARDGIIVMTFDGYEDATEDILSPEIFERSDYESTYLTDQMRIKEGEPVYKLITEDMWYVYVRLSKETAEQLSEKTYVKTRINKDNETIWAEFSVIEKDNHYYGCLCYDNSMIRYSQDRYVTVELILEDQTGLKIPKSTVIEKSFYVVPGDYLDTIRTYNRGVMVKKGDEAVFQTVDIYYTTEENQVYLNPSVFEKDTVLVKPGSMETYPLKETATLPGVYCINKGYAVFKPVTILCENDDYYIVEEGISYSISNYDHIVQNADMIEEDEVVFQ